jgi:hypothetical protein
MRARTRVRETLDPFDRRHRTGPFAESCPHAVPVDGTGDGQGDGDGGREAGGVSHRLASRISSRSHRPLKLPLKLHSRPGCVCLQQAQAIDEKA